MTETYADAQFRKEARARKAGIAITPSIHMPVGTILCLASQETFPMTFTGASTEKPGWLEVVWIYDGNVKTMAGPAAIFKVWAGYL